MNDREFSVPETIRWAPKGLSALILDQTLLPGVHEEKELSTLEDFIEAIVSLRVRGAPLIGITAAVGLAALARQSAAEGVSADALRDRFAGWAEGLANARPTAVNLVWAVRRQRARLEAATGDAAELAAALAAEADAIHEEDRRMCRAIGEHAAALLAGGESVITHCNAGSLATGGIGTALAPVYVAAEMGRKVRVFADETRPLLQGSRLTAWELSRAGIEVTVLADNMAGSLFASDPPDIAFVGSDRIAANGDVANKIGTYPLAVLAHRHGVPFYVLAPTSTVDLGTPTGADIPIEHRDPDEVRRGFGPLLAPEEAGVYSPAFDITPHELVAGIVTERGIHRPPYTDSLAAAVRAAEAERRDRPT
ncbi:MAG: S-methyl-5-thioribose-1-phosphate isomerase [Gemmatimonadota bacterium]|uniref:S-methyl-5-thioribose-1-phosphate isomerase n=1 Tax=Candidatus Palauibacter scopulicola TaxID=3056741 RepID=UPI0023A5E538|nr:S-methyl-5-thioribose-1-phosphate isomerase [Candidatus Palauibacter scopulicola]MDE2663871.1 S-methyl-5-thioribose-1-phosphate isomerase [Candidatus Palauibacter scopulicola]